LLACGAGIAESSAAANSLDIHGSDRVTSPSTSGATNALAAQAAWQAGAGGPVFLQDFESFSDGTSPVTAIQLAPGVSMLTNSSASSRPAGFQVSSGNDILNGFNTTQGGNKSVAWYTDSPSAQMLVFNFSRPIQAFSTWITGPGITGAINDKGSYELKWTTPGAGTGNFFFKTHDPFFDGIIDNAQFVGFVDPNAKATQVELQMEFASSPDQLFGAFAFDDVRWVVAVPEPSTLALLVIGCAMALASHRDVRVSRPCYLAAPGDDRP
jgi:hypothetical protein